MASSGVKQLRSSESQVSTMTVAGAVFGVTAYALMNAMRRKPLMFEPWYHLASIVGFGYLGNALGHMYDDTNAVLNERMMAYARLPSWTYSQLSEKELDAELRQDRLEELRAKYKALALLEEKEYLESGAGAKVGKKAEAGLR